MYIRGATANFNSRPSARGDAGRECRCTASILYFNSRPSARGDAGAALLASRGKFSIHAPPRGATVSHFYSFLLPSFFNSRPSARGDMGVNTTSSRSPFQFTPLREGRPKKQEEPLDGQIFQFTPLREGRPLTAEADGSPCIISIHAPPRGATLACR